MMNPIDKKIDFAVIFSVKHANPNGDPLNGNRPRQNYDGYGEVSDVAIKRKIRNRLQDIGESIFVQSEDRANDGFKSLNDRANGVPELAKIRKDKKAKQEDFIGIASQSWYDVRAFGQVFAFKDDSLSVGIRGPVSIHPAISVEPIDITSIQITKSVNSVTGDKKGSDTMGMKHRVDSAIYKFYGSINPQLAEKTGYTYEDAQKLKEALISLFENDASSARPEGSLEVLKVIWWEHDSKLGQYSSGKVHRSLSVNMKGTEPVIEVKPLDGLEAQLIEGR